MSFLDPITGRSELHQIKGRAVEYVVVMVFVSFLAGYEWLRWAFDIPYQPIWISVFALCIVGYALFRLMLLRPRVRVLEEGQQTWKMILVDFESLGHKGFLLFDGVTDLQGLELGPVLVGPSGVYSISIRSNAMEGKLFERIEHTDRETLLVGSRPALGDPLGQARVAAARLKRFLEANGAGGVPVQPIIAFPGWPLGGKPAAEERDVWVVNEQTLATEVLLAPGHLEPRDIILVSQVLDSRQKKA